MSDDKKTVELTDVTVDYNSEAAIKERKETARTIREMESQRVKNYKPIFFGLDKRDLMISTACLLVLYAITIGIFALFQALVDANKFVKDNDATLWVWFTFGMGYFVAVFGLIATAEPVTFDTEEDKKHFVSRFHDWLRGRAGKSVI